MVSRKGAGSHRKLCAKETCVTHKLNKKCKRAKVNSVSSSSHGRRECLQDVCVKSRKKHGLRTQRNAGTTHSLHRSTSSVNKKKKSKKSAQSPQMKKRTLQSISSQNEKEYNIFPIYLAVLQTIALAETPITLAQLSTHSRTTKTAFSTIKECLELLKKQALILRTRKGYMLNPRVPLITGTLQIQRSGAAFVSPHDTTLFPDDIFIPSHAIGNAWHLDTVTILITQPAKQLKKAEGCILSVIKRHTADIVALFVERLNNTTALFTSVYTKNSASFLVDTQHSPIKHYKNGILYRLSLLEEKKNNLFSAHCIAALGKEDTPLTQEKVTQLHHALPEKFSKKVRTAIKNLPTTIPPAVVEQRQDFTTLPFVTIDGEDAKDFDDAICVLQNTKGYRVFIAIADVTAYVTPNSELDAAAFSRGNSYYFPSSVIPMLPEILSNDLCSLKPHVPRLAMVLELHCSNKGTLLHSTVHEGIIQSKARLTYTQVHEHCSSIDFSHLYCTKKHTSKRSMLGFLPHTHGNFYSSALDVVQQHPKKTTPLSAVLSPDILHAVELAYGFSLILHHQRLQKKALFFNTTTPHFIHTKSTIQSVTATPHFYAHTMIEEYMLLANETVASILHTHNIPTLYRIHPAPSDEKLEKLRMFMRTTFPEVRFPASDAPHFLYTVLEQLKQCNIEHALTQLVLRSMMQACYSPLPAEHYGLQSTLYCHFTSPIRRYADIIVHRSIKSLLHKEYDCIPQEDTLQKIATHINKQERTALDAEREIQRRFSILYIQNRYGEQYNAMIVAITQHAIFLEIIDIAIQVTLLLTEMHDDYYIVDEERQYLQGQRTGKQYTLGDTISIRITSVSFERLEILCVPVLHTKKRKRLARKFA